MSASRFLLSLLVAIPGVAMAIDETPALTSLNGEKVQLWSQSIDLSVNLDPAAADSSEAVVVRSREFNSDLRGARAAYASHLEQLKQLSGAQYRSMMSRLKESQAYWSAPLLTDTCVQGCKIQTGRALPRVEAGRTPIGWTRALTELDPAGNYTARSIDHQMEFVLITDQETKLNPVLEVKYVALTVDTRESLPPFSGTSTLFRASCVERAQSETAAAATFAAKSGERFVECVLPGQHGKFTLKVSR
jgi:hypothetical protein